MSIGIKIFNDYGEVVLDEDNPTMAVVERPSFYYLSSSYDLYHYRAPALANPDDALLGFNTSDSYAITYLDQDNRPNLLINRSLSSSDIDVAVFRSTRAAGFSSLSDQSTDVGLRMRDAQNRPIFDSFNDNVFDMDSFRVHIPGGWDFNLNRHELMAQAGFPQGETYVEQLDAPLGGSYVLAGGPDGLLRIDLNDPQLNYDYSMWDDFKDIYGIVASRFNTGSGDEHCAVIGKYFGSSAIVLFNSSGSIRTTIYLDDDVSLFSVGRSSFWASDGTFIYSTQSSTTRQYNEVGLYTSASGISFTDSNYAPSSLIGAANVISSVAIPNYFTGTTQHYVFVPCRNLGGSAPLKHTRVYKKTGTGSFTHITDLGFDEAGLTGISTTARFVGNYIYLICTVSTDFDEYSDIYRIKYDGVIDHRDRFPNTTELNTLQPPRFVSNGIALSHWQTITTDSTGTNWSCASGAQADPNTGSVMFSDNWAPVQTSHLSGEVFVFVPYNGFYPTFRTATGDVVPGGRGGATSERVLDFRTPESQGKAYLISNGVSAVFATDESDFGEMFKQNEYQYTYQMTGHTVRGRLYHRRRNTESFYPEARPGRVVSRHLVVKVFG